MFSAVENLVGSPLGDTLVGNSVSNRLDGLAGNDTLICGANTDSGNGGTGVDVTSTRETLIAIP